MKKWLRIVFFLSFLVIAAPFPLVIIQAQERGPTIKNATVEKISDSKSDQAKLSIILDLDADEKVSLELTDNEQANFDEESEIKIDEKQIKADYDNDNPEQLMVENVTPEAQTVTLEVPLAINYQTNADKLKLQLLLNHNQEKYDVPEFDLSNNVSEPDITEPNTKTVFENQTETPTKTNDKVESKVSQKQVTARQVKKQAESSTAKAEATEADEDDDGEDQKKATPKADSPKTPIINPSESVEIPKGELNIYRTQILNSSWSSKLSIDTGQFKTNPAEIFYKPESNGGGNYWSQDSYQTNYYNSYYPGDAYAVKLPDAEPDAKTEFKVKYDNVGEYYEDGTENAIGHSMGAVVTISNIKYRSYSEHKTNTSDHYIDFSTNFYSGLLYTNIDSFDIDITFIGNDGEEKQLILPNSSGINNNSFITFGSLNGKRDNPDEGEANPADGNECAGTNNKDSNGNYIQGILANPTKVTDRGDGWYEGVGEGVWDKNNDTGEYLPHTGIDQWGDFLGSINYEKGAVSFPLSGTTHKFKLKSTHGFVWQSLAGGSVMPRQPADPVKTVHRTNDINVDNNDLDDQTIDRVNSNTADKNMSSFYYTVYQETYNIPNASIAKPNNIIFTDTLPEGMQLAQNSSGRYQIRLINTKDKVNETDDVITELANISYDSTTRKIIYSLTDKEIESLKFNGGHFAIQMKVTFPENFIGTFTNKAKVKFDSGVNYTWENETNEVITHFTSNTDTLQLEKKGESPFNPGEYSKLSGVTFKLEVLNGDGTTNKIAEYTTDDKDGKVSLTGLDRNKTYILTENEMDGYEPLGDSIKLSYNESTQKWTVSDHEKVTISDKTITVNNTVPRDGYNFQKIDSASKNGLNGAKFVVKHGNDYLTFDANGKMTGTATSQTSDTLLESKSVGETDGLINISGLPHGTYTLIEVKAPDGYALNSNPIPFEITDTSGGGAQPKQIENTRYSLPVTGGSGIIWIVIIGLISISLSLAIRRTHPRGG
ncbi:SpaA isopeptide-forming pilin-related protein [Lentilactobacillus senioris]|uniref:MSCRAMM family protein n=1 Tax=Lentilactobacillus senioris TaxID=931534 RepID=UPI00227E06E3|nr:SpaA isopeptide-forming pilin-related protein [Lentilactobacillus senioris]MCY9806033.1 SpaA isopeptide-forming pilin-related protein [Lentilactobacillus senioris]